MAFPLTGGATLAGIAAETRAYGQNARHVPIMRKYVVDDYVALDWIRQADEAGYDTGRPRDKRKGL